MGNRYIKFSFYNAKLFPKNIKTKDFVSNIGVTKKDKLIFQRTKRAELEHGNFIEPITMYQISNMLHTLVGERPVPSFRYTFYSMDDNIFSLAKNSLLRIDSPKVTKIIKGETTETFIDEFTKVSKSADNSWRKYNTIQWFKVKVMMDIHFDEFINLINMSLGYNVLDKPFEDLLNSYSIHGSKLDEAIQFLLKNKKTPISDFLTKDNPDRSGITRYIALRETIVNGIDNVHILNGEILVPYDENFVNRLIKNTTNILDGGYVKLEGVYYEDELYNLDDFKLMSEISTEKY
jgi:hypothetical protein